jgi:hypothetical protein
LAAGAGAFACAPTPELAWLGFVDAEGAPTGGAEEETLCLDSFESGDCSGTCCCEAGSCLGAGVKGTGGCEDAALALVSKVEGGTGWMSPTEDDPRLDCGGCGWLGAPPL